jgi:hypothetical protein
MNKQKDINIFLTKNNKNYYNEDLNYLSMIKIWNSIKDKYIKIRNKNKLQSSYSYTDETKILEQNSDNESDTTKFENTKYNYNRSRKINSLKCNNKKLLNYSKNLYHNDKSLHIKRNKDDEYEIILK